mgnify:CR=1 FL=1
MSHLLRCAWCHSKHVHAEFVDVGVGGGGLQITPYGCDECHSYEIGRYALTQPENYSAEELKRGWVEGEFYRDVMQRHSDYMLRMRRVFKYIAMLLRLQDIHHEITDEEAAIVCQAIDFDEMHMQRALKRTMDVLEGKQ